MTESLADDSLAVQRAAAGDHAAFAALVGIHSGDMARLSFAISGDRELARDAVQTAWVIAWAQLPQLRRPERLRAWLLTLTANETKRVLRRNAGRWRLETEVARHRPAVAGDGAGGIDLREALSSLSAKQRELLGLRYGVGLRSHEIGSHLGIPASTVRVRLSRALAQLRKELDP